MQQVQAGSGEGASQLVREDIPARFGRVLNPVKAPTQRLMSWL